MEISLTSKEVGHMRMANQQLTGTDFTQPAELVQWMGCLQAQDYAMAKWAIGCRLGGMTDAAVEKDFNEGKILRTHVLRPTWHFICPADIRWMLKLSAPRVRAMSRPYHQKLGIDDILLRRSKMIMEKALGKHRRLTREEIISVLHKEKVNVDEGRAGFLLIDAELDALICSAGRSGKKFCYQLLDEVAPVSDLPDYEESIARLAQKYFFSRGPATIRDFAWWGNLTLTEATKGLHLNKRHLQRALVNGEDYWFAEKSLAHPATGRSTFLLPAFDEYMVAYRNRNDVLEPRNAGECNSGLGPVILYNGQAVGTWRRTGKKELVPIELGYFGGIPPRTRTVAVAAACKRYLGFIEGSKETHNSAG